MTVPSSPTRIRRTAAAAGVTALALTGLAALPSSAEDGPLILYVNAFHDAVDATVDGVCDTGETPGEPQCTLRAAIQEANAHAGKDSIEVASGHYILSIEGASEDEAATGDLDITDPVVITGHGEQDPVIEMTVGDRVFDIHPDGEYSDVGWLGITGGSAPVGEDGGGMRVAAGNVQLQYLDVYSNRTSGNGGGLWSASSSLSIFSVVLRSNEATNGGGAWLDGQPDGTGWMEIGGFEAVENSAELEGGGLWVGSGFERLDIHFVRFADNSATRGAGLWVGGDASSLESVALGDTVFTGNQATAEGGGLWLGLDGGSVRVARAEFRDNGAVHGGGFRAGPLTQGAMGPRLLMDESVILDNEAAAPQVDDEGEEAESRATGGGAWLVGLEEVFLRDVRILGNDADDGSGLAIQGGGHVDIGWSSLVDNAGDSVFAQDLSSLRLINTTIAAVGDRTTRLRLDGGEVLLDHTTLLGDSEAPALVEWGGSPEDFEVRASVIEACEEGVLTSLGHNWVSPDCFASPTDTDHEYGDREDLGLTPIRDNGGFIPGWPVSPDTDVLTRHVGDFNLTGSGLLTYAPIDESSPLVDAAGAICPQTDQRMVPRPVGEACDVGAVEYAPELADLRLGFADNQWEVQTGEQFTYRPEVWSEGPHYEVDVTATFVVELPAEVTFVSADDRCDAPDANGHVFCTVSFDGVSAEDGRAEIVVTAPDEPTTLEVVGRIVAWSPTDPNPFNQEATTSTLVYESSDPDPDPGVRADADGDGVADAIDPVHQPDPEAPGSAYGYFIYHDGGTDTHGRIHFRHGHDVFAEPDPDPPVGQSGRVLITVRPDAPSSEPAVVSACGLGSLRLLPLSAVVVRCGSLITEVLEGEAEIVLNDGTVVHVPEGLTAYVDEREDGTVVIEHRGGAGVLTVESGGVVRTLGPGDHLGTVAPQAPVAPSPTVNSVKAGSAVPLKWTVVSADGSPVTGLHDPVAALRSLDCATGEVGATVQSIAIPGLKDQGQGRYHLNWKTPKNLAGTCQVLTLDLGDGYQLTARFSFS